MTIKWTDLEPGDVLKYTDRHKEAAWKFLPQEWKKEQFIIKKIDIREDKIYIHFCESIDDVLIYIEVGLDCEFIKDGAFCEFIDGAFRDPFNWATFEIASLKE